MYAIQILSTVLPLLVSSASAAPALTTRAIPDTWGFQALASTKPIHLQFVSASNRRFFIGNLTSTYCPDIPAIESCPPGTSTVFSGSSGCGLDVEVPGGQQVFITTSGEVGYTAPHSAAVPQDSLRCPFVLEAVENYSSGANATISTTAFGANGFMACPTNTRCESTGIYQVFANLQNATVPGGNVSECIPFHALAYDAGPGPAAWEYA